MDFASWVVERIALNVRVLNQLFRGCLPGRVGRVALALGLLALIPRGAEAASVSIRQAGTLLTSISANAGDLIDLELVVDTGGLTLEGYSIGIDFTGGNVDILGVTHQSVGVLFPDLFGPLSIDNVANTIRNINQANFSGSVAAGTYVVDLISIRVTALGPILVAPGLFGGSLGLATGSCPGTIEGCSVSISTASISQAVPEPATALLLGLVLLGLGVVRLPRHRG